MIAALLLFACDRSDDSVIRSDLVQGVYDLVTKKF